LTQNGTAKGLTAKQARVVAELLAGASLSEAARAVGAGRSTVYRWLGLASVGSALSEGQDVSSKAAAASLSGALELALGVLVSDMRGQDAGRASRAAVAVVGHYSGLGTFLALEARVAELEDKRGM